MATKKAPPTLSKQTVEHTIAYTLSQLPESFLSCRDLRHAWKVRTNFHDVDREPATRKNVARTVERVLECITCGTVRTDTYLVVVHRNDAPRLEKWSTAYVYPSGYQMKRGHAPRDLAVSQLVRYETLRRVLAATREA